MAAIPPKTKYNALVLDFDGALFPRRFFLTPTGADPVLVQVINTLCQHYDFRIVISAGMQEQGIDKCKEELSKAGISADYVMPNNWSTLSVGFHIRDRYKQVERWYDQYKDSIGRMLIFDDEHCPFQSPIAAYWMRCDEEHGLRLFDLTTLYGEYSKLMEHKEDINENK
jgi:hypothetical protein